MGLTLYMAKKKKRKRKQSKRKKETIPSSDRDVEQPEFEYTVGENAKLYNQFENSLVVYYTVNRTLSIQPSSPTVGYLFR